MRTAALLVLLLVALVAFTAAVDARRVRRAAAPVVLTEEVAAPAPLEPATPATPTFGCAVVCEGRVEQCGLACGRTDSCLTKCSDAFQVCLEACSAPTSTFAVVDSSNVEAALADLVASSLPVTEEGLVLGSKAHFDFFKAEQKRSYASAELEAYRYGIFQSNMLRAAELNKLNPSAQFGANQFADLHPEEFHQQYLKFEPVVGDNAILRKQAKLTSLPAGRLGNDSLPDYFDWRKPQDGRPVAVTSVKNQGSCGSCWAFSAVLTAESATILAGKGEDLSVQQTVDCSTQDYGCRGGDTVTAYKYMQAAGMQSEQSYPYTSGKSGVTGKCTYDKASVVARITGFTYATPACFDSCTNQDEELLARNLVESGPVSICVEASVWQTYRSGILTPTSGCKSRYAALNHCVQLTGYGIDGATGAKFWSARNTWAESWGEQGYIRLAYGQNTCGVADEATHVQIM